MPLRIGDQCCQLFLLVTLDKTVCRYRVRSAAEKDAARLVLMTSRLGQLGRKRSEHLVRNVMRV